MTDTPRPETPRLRRLRATPATRRLTRETRVSRDQLVDPHFVVPGQGIHEPIEGLPGAVHTSPDVLVKRVTAGLDDGLRAVLVFGAPEAEDPEGRAAADPAGPVPEALGRLDDEVGDEVLTIADVCLCAYTTHGHCGVLDEDGRVANDASLPRLADAALADADAGADWVAPSDMMDGRVAAIRSALDRAGHTDVGILSYAAKFHSAFYGPFRHAQDSAPEGDRATYQVDPPNARQAVRSVERDVREGADAVLVKPGLAYLDVLRRVREAVDVPVGAYHVSGEHAMLDAAVEAGHLDRQRAAREVLTALDRAGADLIVSYLGRRAAREGWL
jgi:porphobilinogen synthase